MPPPNQLPKLNFPGVDPTFQQWLNQLTDNVNYMTGYGGPIQPAAGIDLQGNTIENVGKPSSGAGAISQDIADGLYSAPVIRPQLEAGGKFAFRGYRQLNNTNQREATSSWLNDLMSTPPNSNAIYPTITNGSGSVTVSIPASKFKFADGSNLILQARTDILSTPAQFAISAISCTGNLVTVDCAASGLASGQVGTIAGVTPSSFNGTFPMLSSSSGGAVLTYQADLGTATGSGGFVQVNGVYYYSVAKRSTLVRLFGPYAGDTLQNRLEASSDGYQIVAVVVITASGGQISQSGGGGSPITGSPTAGSLF